MDAFMTSSPDPAPMSAERLDAASYKSALSKAQRVIESDTLTPLDAVIHGVGVRLHTNSVHWHQFWSANWFAPSQWTALTGDAPPDEPQVHVYAITAEADASAAASPWAGHTTAFLTGDTPYGPLRALALGAVAHWLADEQAVHYVPGVCIKRGAQAGLMLRSSGVDQAAALPALMKSDETHVLAFDGVFIRYGLVRMVDGVTMLPTQILDEQGIATRGYRLFPWLDDYGFIEPRADIRCLTLDGKAEYCFARDLDLGRVPDAMAYPLEQAWYIPTQVVAGNPGLIGALWPGSESQNPALLENLPPLTPELSDRFGSWAREAASALGDAANPSSRSLLDEMGEERVAAALCRLRAAPEARAMVAPEQLWPGRAGGNPWQPLRIRKVTLLGSDDLTPLDASALPEHLADTNAYLSGLYDDEANKILTTELGRAITATD